MSDGPDGTASSSQAMEIPKTAGTTNIDSYFEQYQNLNHGHKTSDPRFAEDWGKVRTYVLFPDHLPDLHTPMKESYNEAIKQVEINPASRLFAKVSTKYFGILISLLVLGLVLTLFGLNVLWITEISPIFPEQMQGLNPLFSLGASSALCVGIWKAYSEYNEGYNKWCVGTQPKWKSLNRKRILDWYHKHIKFLEARGVERQIIDGQGHILREYCRELKALPWKAKEFDTFTTTVTRFDFEAGATLYDVETTDTDEYLQHMDVFLRDEVSKLSSNEKEAYFRFSGLAAGEYLFPIPDGVSYIEHEYLERLESQLHERTNRITSEEVIERWTDLLNRPNFDARKLTKVVDRTNEITVNQLIDEIGSPAEKPRMWAIKGNSGLGKTTLMLQLCIHFLKSSNEKIEPFFIKAREIRKINEFGDIGLHRPQQIDPYRERWLASRGKKLLIVDGIDENTKLMNKLLDRLDKTSNFYHADILLTGRMNVSPSYSFQTYELSNFDDEYLHQMIRRSSDNPENRKRLKELIPSELQQHPLVLFGSAEILSNHQDDFENADLSYRALAEFVFTRDVEESIKKYGQGMPKINLLRRIGSFALQKIINPQEESPVGDPVFDTADNWKLIDENGVNETLTEGYFIMESIENDDDSHELFIQGWDKLMEFGKNDPERWEYYARAFLTSRNENLPPILEFDFTGYSYGYSKLLRIALAEWVRSDLAGKKQIIARLGFQSDDDGRVRLDEGFEFPEEFDESYLYVRLMDFHCGTWSRKSEEWSNRSTDPTWESLAHEIILHECPKIIHRAKMMHHHIAEVHAGREGKFGCYAEFHKDIGWSILYYWDKDVRFLVDEKYNNYLSDFLSQFFSPTDLVPNFRQKDINHQHYLFQTDLLLPTDLNIPGRLSGFSKLPNPITNLFQQILEQLPTLPQHQQSMLLYRLYTFIQAANYGSETAMLFVDRDDKPTIRMFQEAHAHLEGEKQKQILRQIYGLVRGDINWSRKFLLDRSSENAQAWTEIDYAFWHEDRTYLNKEEIVFDKEENEPVPNKRRLESPDQQDFTTVFTGEYQDKLWNLSYQLATVYRRHLVITNFDEDNVKQKSYIFPDKIYSQIPYDLLIGLRMFVLVHREDGLNSNDKYSWGVVPWFKRPPAKLLSVLQDKSSVDVYRRVDELNTWLKVFGKVSNLQQAQSMLKELGLDPTQRYIGTVHMTKKDPDDREYHVHILTGSRKNDFYVSEETSIIALEKLNQEFEKINHDSKTENSTVHIEFAFEIHQLDSNKHCVIVPKDIKAICQSCLETKPNHADYPTLCRPCVEEFQSEEGKDQRLRYHLFMLKNRPDINHDMFSLNLRFESPRNILQERNRVSKIVEFHTQNAPTKGFAVNIDVRTSYDFIGENKPNTVEAIERTYHAKAIEQIRLVVELETSIVIGTSEKYAGWFIGKDGHMADRLVETIRRCGLENIKRIFVLPIVMSDTIVATHIIREYQDVLHKILNIDDSGKTVIVQLKYGSAGILIGKEGVRTKRVQNAIKEDGQLRKVIIAPNLENLYDLQEL